MSAKEALESVRIKPKEIAAIQSDARDDLQKRLDLAEQDRENAHNRCVSMDEIIQSKDKRLEVARGLLEEVRHYQFPGYLIWDKRRDAFLEGFRVES